MKPKIIIIIIDALRPKNLSLFGYEKETDINLKKIATPQKNLKRCCNAKVIKKIKINPLAEDQVFPRQH